MTAAHPTPTPTDTITRVTLPGIVDVDGLIVETAPIPTPADGQLLLRMEATGVSFAEQQMRLGRYYDQPPFPFVPGYDVVGTVEAVGAGVDPTRLGERVAVITKTGGWSSHVVVDARAAITVPAALAADAAETLVVNGVTAWQLLTRLARVGDGGTIVVYGANSGVGTILAQLARLRGIRVIGTSSARHHDALRAAGIEPLDYAEPDLLGSVLRLEPGGVDAVFDHVGGPGLTTSWRMLRRGGALASYGTLRTRDARGSATLPILQLVARLAVWNILPNGRRAGFYNLWSGLRRSDRFWARVHTDLGEVLRLAAEGRIAGTVAARIPLSRAGEALALAESRTVLGKVVLVPDAA
jgi:NADPH:quinone reductase-like Zn-dependent oxidoreductase